MAMTADSTQSEHHDSNVNDGLSPSKQKNLPSPWARVVRGEPESINQIATSPSPSAAAVAEQSAAAENLPAPALEEGNNGNAGRAKKQAWNKPSLSNGVTDASLSPVMGALSWPALSESTKPSTKSSPSLPSESSTKPLPDVSSPNSQGPVIPHSSHKQGTGQSKSNSSHNHTMPARQRSIKRGGGSNGGGVSSSSSAGGHVQNNFPSPSSPPPPPPPPIPFPIFPMPPNGYGNLITAMPDHSAREPPYRANNWEPRAVGGFVSQPPVANDHRHSSRRSNYGPRGDGPHQNNNGGRRDQDRGHYGNVRDANVQRGPPRGFIRPPPPSAASFITAQPMRSFDPMGYHEYLYIPGLHVEPFRGVPFISPHAAPPFVMPLPEPPLHAMLVHQIEYYFSDANLVKDEFLKSKMDDRGWVSITLIAGFNRVKSMTNDIQMIAESLRTSTLLEVQDDKVRRRNDWMRWIPNSGRMPADSGSQPLDAVTTSFQNITMDKAAAEDTSSS